MSSQNQKIVEGRDGIRESHILTSCALDMSFKLSHFLWDYNFSLAYWHAICFKMEWKKWYISPKTKQSPSKKKEKPNIQEQFHMDSYNSSIYCGKKEWERDKTFSRSKKYWTLKCLPWFTKKKKKIWNPSN